MGVGRPQAGMMDSDPARQNSKSGSRAGCRPKPGASGSVPPSWPGGARAMEGRDW